MSYIKDITPPFIMIVLLYTDHWLNTHTQFKYWHISPLCVFMGVLLRFSPYFLISINILQQFYINVLISRLHISALLQLI